MASTKPTTSAARNWIGMLAIASSLVISGQVFAQAEQQELVSKAETTFTNFIRDPDMTWLQRHIGNAKAVLIAPTVVKAGFIVGGAGGRAGLFARHQETGGRVR